MELNSCCKLTAMQIRLAPSKAYYQYYRGEYFHVYSLPCTCGCHVEAIVSELEMCKERERNQEVKQNGQ